MNVPYLGNANSLGNLKSELKFCIDCIHYFLALVFPLVGVIQIDFSNIKINVLVDSLVSQHHDNLSLPPHFIQYAQSEIA